MRGVVFTGDRKLEIMEFPDPEPGPREVVLEIKASGMCGSDLHDGRARATLKRVVSGVAPSRLSRVMNPVVLLPRSVQTCWSTRRELTSV